MGLHSAQTTYASQNTSPLQRGNTDLIRETRLVPIRVLYTLDTSPQYLLARQKRRVQVIPILEEDNESASSRSPRTPEAKQRYAKVSLKTCLSAVCNSSPELVADRSRDYSVYVVDPLESPLKMGSNTVCGSDLSTANPQCPSSPSSTSCPWGEGVSIGMGLMSWCLAGNNNTAEVDDDEESVIGKLVKDRGSETLEIVMSLRETTTQTQRQHALSLSSWGLQGPFATAVPEYSYPNASQLPSHFPTSPSPSQLPTFPTLSQTSTVNTTPEDEYLSEREETPMPQMPSSSAPDATVDSSQPLCPSLTASAAALKRIGRPPGSRTHPEKRARRLAIQTHRERLERLEHIAKMQRGEKYDKTLIIACDHDGPKVTKEEIAQQRKLLEELETRPLIVDQLPKICLTNNPLPKRAASVSKKVSVKRKSKAAPPANAVASGSGTKDQEAHAEQQLGAELLLSLLTSVLGKVDEPTNVATTAGLDSPQDDGKGKAKLTGPDDNALAGALRQLLPQLPNNMAQSSTPSGSVQVPPTNLAASTSNTRMVSSYPSSAPFSQPPSVPSSQRPFQTTEEVFYSRPPRAPTHPLDEVWTSQSMVAPDRKNSIPKVREDAHPVPGGGWARGRRLVPRDAIPQSVQGARSRESAVQPSGETAANASTNVAAPDKENLPPAKTKRGLKRAFVSASDAKENGNSSEAVASRIGAKKRKQETTPPTSSSDRTTSENTERVEIRSAEGNQVNISRASGMIFAASSPVRRTAYTSAARNMPVIAMSEPDYLPTKPASLPIMAPSTPPGSTIETPKTPPRHDRALEDDAGGSLFTPCASESTSRRPGNGLLSDNPLFSPSPVPANPRGSHVGDASQDASATTQDVECQAASLRHRHVSTGWDLPPSSPPPPTSPILPSNAIGVEEDDQMDFKFAMQLQSELDVEMEKAGTDGRFEDGGIAIYSDVDSTPGDGAQQFVEDDDTRSDQCLHHGTPFSPSDVGLSSEGTFDFGELADGEGTFGSTSGIELDIEELWGSLGPVIAHAQADVNDDPEALPQGTADASFFGFRNNQIHVEAEGQSGVDPVKLAEDLKALFGGCVV